MLDDAGTAIGRVHTAGQPAMRLEDNALAFRLDLVARGAPLGLGVVGLSAFFEAAVSAINSVFLASVTHAGRKFWGEQNGDRI